MTVPTEAHGSPDGDPRWELGSDFDLTLEAGTGKYPWTERPYSLWGSGRDAIRGLLEWGARTQAWRRVLMPSYFCQDVVAAALRSMDVHLYPWSPLDDHHEPVTALSGDVVFVPAMFGRPPAVDVLGSVPIIEDHSHDLLATWALASRAEYAIASMRKTLPLPDGGVVWSPRGLEIPSAPEMTPHHAATIAQRLSAMVLKHHYLAGDDIAKQIFRDAMVESEQRMASGPITGISPFSQARMPTLPAEQWRSRRAENLAAFRAEVGSARGVRFLDVPFAAMLVFDDERRRAPVRETLIASGIYPSVLWPLEHPAVIGIPPAHVEVSRCMLSIHVDHRYDANDILRAANLLKAALDAH